MLLQKEINNILRKKSKPLIWVKDVGIEKSFIKMTRYTYKVDVEKIRSTPRGKALQVRPRSEVTSEEARGVPQESERIFNINRRFSTPLFLA
jgi:hypothetical protein